VSDITRILVEIEQGDPKAAEELLPLVYHELRRLAAARLAQEKPGQTLQATALVHEAYLRMVGSDAARKWNGRNHFFAAAAEAMRRILVESARRKNRVKHGGRMRRHDLAADPRAEDGGDPIEVLAIHEALEHFEKTSPRKAELVKLKYFVGLTVAEAAEVLGIAPATAEDDWRYAKAWLKRYLTRAKK
jgi:RNA polymerase sigma factor (TIGR02999 family)